MLFSTYAAFLFTGAITSCLLIYYAWRNRKLAAPLPFILLMLAAAEWSTAYALVIISPQLPMKTFWLKASYLGVSTITPLWLIFILQ